MRSIALILSLLGVAVVPAGAWQGAGSAQPETAAYYFLLGRRLEGQGKIEQAVAALRKSCDLAPKDAEPYAELAALYARQNRALEAVEAAEQALQRDRANREANRVLGTVYAALSEQRHPLRPGDDPRTYGRKAAAALEQARRDGVFDVNLELTLGRLYVEAGEHAKAIAPLRRVVDDQPGYPEVAMMLAAAHAEAGQPDAAIRVLEQGVKSSPTFFRGIVRLAEYYDEQRRFVEAADAYARAQALNPRADLTTARATALVNAGQPAEARAMLQAAIKQRGTPDGALLYLLAQAQRRLGDREGTAATIRQLKQAFPNDLRGVLLDALVSEDEQRYDDAIVAFKTLVDKVPDDPTFVYQYANLLEKAGRPADAERALRDLLARDPADADALNSLGYMFAERGERLDEAVELLTRALAVEPANPSYLDSLGWAYFQQGRLDLAEPPLAKAAADLPRSSAVQDHLGDLRFRQERFADAAAAWQRALDGDGEGIDRARIERKLREVRERIRK
jgi:tetratricopeptide (TPR) repeat protein